MFRPPMSFGFLPYQSRWINDHSRLKIIEKSRQIGITYADAFDSVRKAASKTSGNHVWVSSRDELTSRLYLDHCKRWAQIAERARERFGSKVEGITFNPTIKEEMAFALRTAFEDRTLRTDPDPKLRSALRGIKKLVTSAGKIRFLADEVGRTVPGEPSGHCDRSGPRPCAITPQPESNPASAVASLTAPGAPVGRAVTPA